MILCPFHGETKPSMRIYRDHYYCFGCGACGDHVDWLVQVEGLEYDQALLHRRQLGRPGCSAIARAQDDAERTARALRWWNGAQPIAGTLAARYLAEVRGIDLDVLPDDISERALRFHPNCVFGPGTRHPCLIALMRNPVSGQPTGIHRIALTPDAQKIDRMMLGLAGVVQLWPAGRLLVIGEGLETMLAAATRLPYRGAPLRPAWAMLSDGAMARFPVIDGVERLIVLADNDLYRRGAGGCRRMQAALAAGRTQWRPAHARSPRHRFQRHRSRTPGARIMSGFTEEEFEPDAGGAKAGDTTANANGHDTGNNARNNAGGQRWKHRGEHRRRGQHRRG